MAAGDSGARQGVMTGVLGATGLDIHRPIADETLTLANMQHVEAVPNGVGDVNLTLPSPESCPGRWAFIRSNGNAANNIVVTTPDPTPLITMTLTADADNVLLYSTGWLWVLVVDVTT